MIILIKAVLSDCEEMHNIRINAFSPLLEKYQDYDTNPANKPIEHIIQNMQNSVLDFFLIKLNKKTIGYIRIRRVDENKCNFSQIAILQEYQGKGYAQEAIKQIENLYPNVNMWELETIKQENKLCHLYEKLGYILTGKEQNINDKMDILFYEKRICSK